MQPMPDICRIALSPFDARNRGVHTVLGDLAPKGFPTNQLCLVGTPSVIAPLAASIEQSSSIYPQLSHLTDQRRHHDGERRGAGDEGMAGDHGSPPQSSCEEPGRTPHDPGR
jgi:hypothetical protein